MAVKIIEKIRGFLLGDPQKAVQKSYIWNTVGGILNAGQSALLLVVLSRTNPQEDAGVFSIAYAIASLALTLGSFGMRTYQATDVEQKYSFGEYVSSRVVTSLLMLLLMLYYIVRGIVFLAYPADKCMVIVFVTLLKLVDVLDDVFGGLFQQQGRLDVAARSSVMRYLIFLTVFALSLCFTHDLCLSAGIGFLTSLALFVFHTSLVYGFFAAGKKLCIAPGSRRVYRLLGECFSLFAGGFLMIYVANAPKYAIDACMDERVQASFNYVFMPVYVVATLNSLIYQPILTKMADALERGSRKAFQSLFDRQIRVIGALLLLVLAGGALLGIPVLSFLFHTDLGEYWSVLMVLLLGSGFLAVAGYLGVAVTIMRRQQRLLAGYVVSALLSLLATKRSVMQYGVMGGAVVYTGIVMIQMLLFALLYLTEFRKIAGED